LVFNSNNDPAAPPGPEPGNAATARPAAPADAAPTPPAAEPPPSPAVARFNSCRWQQPAEEGNAAFCTHREVKPYAGTTGFDAEAWCAECQYYKLRRVPKKRQPSDEYTY
jgi:hypothetical protein